ncbi:MAG: 50S ribosomal protein L31 [Deltaproteobacteria bacterium]|nr:50S ribosomal protein L31 [Deltaproteobacteria bacterium]
MNEKIHPAYHQTTIRCACGNEIPTGSTRKDIRVEICSQCHPFFTGKQKIMDSAGRIERFQKKYANVLNKKAAKAEETQV